tara:strand:- start:563 stop:994 length:432 start_codon:yes stop_codon:yes gene_type:complete
MSTTTKPSTSFWVISAIGLLWNLLGANQYVQQAYKTDAFKSLYTQEQLEIIANMPAWATAAFAVGVFGGVLGCILLLLRKKQAKLLFQISLLGIIVQMIYNFFIANITEVYGPLAIIMPIMILIIALFLLSYARQAAKKDLLS